MKSKRRFGRQMTLPKNRILEMEVIPLFTERVEHGEMIVEGPAKDLPHVVIFSYYDGRKTRSIVHDTDELEVLKLYYQHNVEAWSNDEEYD